MSELVKLLRCWTGGGPQNKVWNWGDAISPEIYKRITGQAPVSIDFTDLTSEPHLVMCGSTMKWITPGSIVWGTGEIIAGAAFMLGDVRPLHVAAVRGPLTQARLEEAGISCPMIYGDPALLFPSFYRPRIEPRYELGVIPHYIDADLPFLDSVAGREDVRILDITRAGHAEKIYSFIDEVLSCRRIVSSTLHGLIAAEAYGVPAVWAKFSDRVVGNGFKFHDYYRSVGRDLERLTILGQFDDPREAMAAVDRSHEVLGPIAFDPQPLLNAFPGDRG